MSKTNCLANLCAALFLLVACATQDLPSVCNQANEELARTRINERGSGSATVTIPGGKFAGQALTALPDEEGRLIVEGDIVVSRNRGATIEGDAYRWPNGVVPYDLGTLSNPSRATSAMRKIESSSRVRFVPRTTQPDYISFKDGSQPRIGLSPVGRQGGKQTITLGSQTTVGTAIHEIMHSLGAWHEQSRHDRDTYVCVIWDNIQAGAGSQFKKYISGADVGPYDFDSIMHYFPTAFSKDGRSPTLAPRPPYQNQRIGQQDHLSVGDKRTLAHLYGN